LKFQVRFKTRAMNGEILYPRAEASLTARHEPRIHQWETAMKKLTGLIAVAGIAAIFCVNAEAGTPSAVPTETVRFSDLQVDSVHDVAVLYRRIDAAAGRVCGQRVAPGSPFVSKSWRRCEQNAVRHAVVEINTPAVTAYAATQGVLLYDSSIARRN
jgi:UrcA family protein